MNCRSFRKMHVTYVDGLMDERQSALMHAHLDECERCARWNTAIRRGLLMARNLPAIQPSPDFMARLEMRLASAETRPGIPTRIEAGDRKRVVRAAIAVAIAVSAVVMIRANRTPSVPLTVPAPVAVAQSQTTTGRHNGPALSEPELARMLATVVPVWIPAEPSSGDPTVQLVNAGLQAPSLSP